jgi:phage FluMu protein Com
MCTAKHTKLQIGATDPDWKCPQCGAVEEVTIDELADGSGECELLHDNDELRCSKCGYALWGKAFSKLIIKKRNLIPCPCCHGTGLVKKDKIVPV